MRGDLYAGEGFAAFRQALKAYAPARPEALADSYFQAPEPQELIHQENEMIWASIDLDDRWGPFEAKLAAIEQARQAYGLSD